MTPKHAAGALRRTERCVIEGETAESGEKADLPCVAGRNDSIAWHCQAVSENENAIKVLR